jgi:DNA-directed RNA polymerase specialized sigma subunit
MSFFAHPVGLSIMSTAHFGKPCAGGQDWQTRIALSNDRTFERLLETGLPLVRPFVHHIKRRLPHSFEVDELENVAVTGLLAAARDYRALQDGDFVGYAVTRIRDAILGELRRRANAPSTTRSDRRRLNLAIAKL